MADIVIANMRHLPKNPPPITSKLGNIPMTSQTCSGSNLSQAIAPSIATVSQQAPVFASQVASPFSSAIAGIASLSDVNIVSNLPADSKRDPRRVFLINFYDRLFRFLNVCVCRVLNT